MIPPNWWHAIYNAEDAVAVTENGVSLKSFHDEVFGDATTQQRMKPHAGEDLAEQVEQVFGLEDKDAAEIWLARLRRHLRAANKRADVWCEALLQKICHAKGDE